ncbi:MAG TPA: AAA family ATPase [Candidatus Saccharimonadia bacterium]
MKLLLHPAAETRVNAITARPGGSVLLYGPQNVGKRTIAYEIARRLNCRGCEHDDCRSCRMVVGGNHPDVIRVSPDEKGKIGIEQVHQLVHDLQYERYDPAGQRVVVIDQAHRFTLPAQQALLKCLEEPPEATTMVVTCENLQALLPTVVSRCRPVHIPPVSINDLTAFLKAEQPALSDTIDTVARLSEGAPGMAISLLNDPEALEQHNLYMLEAKKLFETEDLFEKLQLAAAMAIDGKLENHLSVLTSVSHGLIRQNKALGSIAAIERLRQRLRANVSPKTALEAMVVELA